MNSETMQDRLDNLKHKKKKAKKSRDSSSDASESSADSFSLKKMTFGRSVTQSLDDVAKVDKVAPQDSAGVRHGEEDSIPSTCASHYRRVS